MIWTKPPGNYVPAVNLPGCTFLLLFKGEFLVKKWDFWEPNMRVSPARTVHLDPKLLFGKSQWMQNFLESIFRGNHQGVVWWNLISLLNIFCLLRKWPLLSTLTRTKTLDMANLSEDGHCWRSFWSIRNPSKQQITFIFHAKLRELPSLLVGMGGFFKQKRKVYIGYNIYIYTSMQKSWCSSPFVSDAFLDVSGFPGPYKFEM